MNGSIAFLTVGSMEQLGNQFENFLNFIEFVNPSVVINIEPIIEFYDENNEFDYSAIQYHKMRGYLEGYFKGVENRMTVVESFRSYFGNIYNEGYSVIVWNPKKN